MVDEKRAITPFYARFYSAEEDRPVDDVRKRLKRAKRKTGHFT
jgi:hypothetical protein